MVNYRANDHFYGFAVYKNVYLPPLVKAPSTVRFTRHNIVLGMNAAYELVWQAIFRNIIINFFPSASLVLISTYRVSSSEKQLDFLALIAGFSSVVVVFVLSFTNFSKLGPNCYGVSGIVKANFFHIFIKVIKHL